MWESQDGEDKIGMKRRKDIGVKRVETRTEATLPSHI